MSARQVLAVTLAGQRCGIDVRAVRDVTVPPPATQVPLAPPGIAGLFNLRGRIVTAIDLRRRLGLAAGTDGADAMSVVVESGGELFGLRVDSVGEVLSLAPETVMPCPPTLAPPWRRVCAGICRLEEGPMVLLDCAAVLDFGAPGRER